MILKPHPPTAESSVGSDVFKKTYQRPELHIYGAVRQFTQGTKNNGNDGVLGFTMSASDRAIKCNVVQVGTHPFGIGLYLFDYKPEFQKEWGLGRQFGVMADEVEAVMPQAVCVHANGYKMVDYAMLGVEHSVH